MLCLACGAYGHPLCAPCGTGLKPAPSVQFADLKVHPGWAHTATAARLVHNLKYRRSLRAGLLLADRMAEIVPFDVDTLIPLPRVVGRRVACGIDQAVVLADMVHDLTGIPVVRALRAPLWHRRLAGRDRRDRSAPAFSRMREAYGRIVLVDDVFTTGTTMRAAAATVSGPGPVSCLVATYAWRSAAATLTSQDRGIGSSDGGAQSVTEQAASLD